MADIQKGDNTTAILQTLKNELLKSYAEYDVSGILTSLYEAVAHAKDGEKCLRTDYEYAPGSSRVVKRKESLASWDSSWDL